MKKLFRAKNLILLSTFSTPLYLVKFNFFSVPTNVLEIFILLSFVFSAYEKRMLPRKFIQQHEKYLYPILLILSGLLLSTWLNKNYLVGLGIIKSWFVVPLLFAFSLLNSIRKRDEMEAVLKIFYASTFIVSLIGIFYSLSRNLTYDLRLQAFHLSPNYLAMFLAPGIIIGISYITQRVPNIKNFKFLEFKNFGLFGGWKETAHQIQILESGNYLKKYFTGSIKPLLLAASFSVILIAFYLTYSYATWVSVAISFAIINIIKKSNLKGFLWGTGYCLLVAATMILLIALFQWHNPKFQDLVTLDERSSLASRLMIWKSAIKITADNPLFGIGPGNFQNKYLEYQKYFPFYLEWAVPQPHNVYLAFWLQSGLLGLLGFLRLIALWLKALLSAVRHQKSAFHPLETALLAIMLYTLIHGFLDTPYWKNDLAVVFWMVFALGISLQQTRSNLTRSG